MTTMQQQARALGDPTRHRIFSYLLDTGVPVGVAELTDHLGFNHNAIRQHLAKLVAAGLLVEATAPPQGPGRPRLLYEIDPTAESRWGIMGPYERLSAMLVEIIRTGEAPIEVGREEGRRQPGGGNGSDATDHVIEFMARQGFEPRVQRNAEGVEVVLDHCPFASAAAADPTTICALHRGMAEGLVEGSDLKVVDQINEDPYVAGCRLILASDS